MTEKRTVRDFQLTQDPWSEIDQWARAQGYERVGQTDLGAEFQKGKGLMTGARHVVLSTDGGKCHLEAWISANFGARLMSLFILPSEITIESGGAKAVLPRKLGRQEVNDLLATLGQPSIT